MKAISWKIIDTYFKENPNNLVAHHINSCNDFYSRGISSILKENNPIRFIERSDRAKNPEKLMEASLYIGGIDGNKIYYGKPVIYDDTHVHYMYPNEARLRDMTYGFTVHVDVDVEYLFYDEDGNEQKHSSIIPNIYIGKFPIMLQSNLCVLNGLDKQIRFQLGECLNDVGGYFLIQGKEKVIVSQEKFADNIINVAINNDDHPYKVKAEIRSVSENAAKAIRTTGVYIDAKSKQLVVLVPNVRQPVPLFILMRALGATSDKDIIQRCILDLDKNKKYIEMFRPSVHDSCNIYNQQNALEYIAELTKRTTVINVLEILSDFFLPHIGELNFLEKSYFIGYMAFKVLKVYVNDEQPTDRDSFKSKRVELSGMLMYDLFREYYLQYKREIGVAIDREHFNNSTVFASKEDLIYMIENPTNLRKYFGDKIVEKGIMKGFKGNWGSEAYTKRMGIVQDLNRLSWGTAISHLRKINLPIDSGSKLVKPRLLNGSQWCIIDPADSPDGGNIGVHKLLSITVFISSYSSGEPIKKWLFENEYFPIKALKSCIAKEISDSVKVFVNGNWIGITESPIELLNVYKWHRRNAVLPTYSSIRFDISSKNLEIWTDSGRIMRPVYYIGDHHRPSFLREQMKNNNISWVKLISGFAVKKDEKFEAIQNKVYDIKELYDVDTSKDKRMDFLVKNACVLDYIDTNESESTLIAMDETALKPENPDARFYTHIEIDPSVLYGVMGNFVIFPEHNASARSVFSCGQSKQAVSMYHTNYQNRIDKMGVVLHYGQTPIVKSRYMKLIHNDEMYYGVNALVAIMSYTGYNVEDGVLINEGAIKRGMFRTTYYTMYHDHEEISEKTGQTSSKFMNIENNTVFDKKQGYDYSYLDDYGMIKENTPVNDKMIMIGKASAVASNTGITWYDESTKAKKGQMGFVDKSFLTDGEEGHNIAKVRVREERLPEIGDKMASRSGQKGTIGLIIKEEDMPFNENGIRPDIIINPHALPTRMTIGHLIECVYGLLGIHYGAYIDCTAFQMKGNQYETFKHAIQDAGFHSKGNSIFYNGMNGQQVEADVYFGPTYYMRLKHMVKDKINYRARGPNTSLNHQPVQGRAADGGLRIGEMERDATISHGISHFLQESFMERSDDYQLVICNKTGMIAIYNEAQKLFLSPYADGPIQFNIPTPDNISVKNISKFGKSFSVVKVPYSLKLLMHELQSMGISMKIITEDNINQFQNLTGSDNVLRLTNRLGKDTVQNVLNEVHLNSNKLAGKSADMIGWTPVASTGLDIEMDKTEDKTEDNMKEKEEKAKEKEDNAKDKKDKINNSNNKKKQVNINININNNDTKNEKDEMNELTQDDIMKLADTSNMEPSANNDKSISLETIPMGETTIEGGESKIADINFNVPQILQVDAPSEKETTSSNENTGGGGEIKSISI